MSVYTYTPKYKSCIHKNKHIFLKLTDIFGTVLRYCIKIYMYTKVKKQIKVLHVNTTLLLLKLIMLIIIITTKSNSNNNYYM